MKKVIIDTDVMVAALCSDKGKSRELLLHIIDGAVAMGCSVPLFMEYEAVLTREKNLQRAGLSKDDVVYILDDLAGTIIPIGRHFNWRPIAQDPDDDLVIETAVNGNIKTIVSFNLKDMKVGAERFGIEVIRPAVFMERYNNG